MNQSALSEVFWEVAISLYETRGHLVTNFRADLRRERAALYSSCITRRAGSLPQCFGFLDGTRIQIARPGGNYCDQRSVYSGYKRHRCVNYQTITTPDGLLFHIYGLVEGRRSDLYVYRESRLEDDLQEKLFG